MGPFFMPVIKRIRSSFSLRGSRARRAHDATVKEIKGHLFDG